MLLDIVKKGSTDRSVTIKILDANGDPDDTVLYNTTDLDLWYRRESGAVVSITEAELATPAVDDAHLDGGFINLGDGYYRLDLPDAAYATGANHFDVGGSVPDKAIIGGRVRLVDIDLEDAVRGGMTALPDADADAAGGLYISEAGGISLDSLGFLAQSMVPFVVDAGSDAQSFVTELTEATDEHYRFKTACMRTGALAGQNLPVVGYDGTAKTLRVVNVTGDIPADGDLGILI